MKNKECVWHPIGLTYGRRFYETSCGRYSATPSGHGTCRYCGNPIEYSNPNQKPKYNEAQDDQEKIVSNISRN